ncbi:MAG: flagellar M-ring protein FliF C-terminal domain-containing protein [Phycisphaerales bacterium]
MQRLQAIYELIREQLGRLTPAHKLLIGSSVIIGLMSLFIVVQYAGRPDMVEITLDADGLTRAAQILRTNEVRFEHSNTGLLVSQNQYSYAYGLLGEHNIGVGSHTKTNLHEMLKDQPWWQNRQQNQQSYNVAIGMVLSDVIEQWSYVRKAQVIINSPLERQGLGQAPRRATASVSITPKSGPLDQSQIEAVANMVAGAVDNLSAEDVKIIADGRSMRVKSNDELVAGSYLELRAKWENDYEEKIGELLRFIPNVIVAVNAQVDAGREQIQDRSYKPEGDGTISVPSRIDSVSQETTGGSRGGEPGVRSNAGMEIGGGSTRETASTKTREDTSEFDNHPGLLEISRLDPGGFARKINATINVPRSYFVAVWKSQNPDATEEPTDAEVAPIVASETASIRAMVEPIVDTTALNMSYGGETPPVRGEVSVNMYHDFAIATLIDAGASQGASIGPFSMPNGQSIGGVVKTVALGSLALVSLFMMFRLVKGATHREELPSAAELVGLPPSLQSEANDLVGEADEAEPAMDAIEMEDEELRVRQLSEQVEELVNANPSEAGRLLNRWMNPEG